MKCDDSSGYHTTAASQVDAAQLKPRCLWHLLQMMQKDGFAAIQENLPPKTGHVGGNRLRCKPQKCFSAPLGLRGGVTLANTDVS